MPSGLTHNIYDGSDTSLRGFALKCVGQLGAGYHATKQGEEEMPLDRAPILQVSDHYLARIDEHKRNLEKWTGLKNNPEELDRLIKNISTKGRKNMTNMLLIILTLRKGILI